MDYKILVANEHVWHKDCSRIPKKDLLRIFARIPLLATHPWLDGVDVKNLQHYGAADFRLRVGDYRVLFNKYDATKQIRLLRVLHRSKLY